MTKANNSMLTEITEPQHRPLLPGELTVLLDGARGAEILLLYGDHFKGTKTAATTGKWELVTRKSQPVLLASRDGSIALPDLNLFVGLPLAAEFAAIMEKLRAASGSPAGYAQQVVRFRRPAQFNDLMVGLAWHHLGTPRRDTLTRLLTDLDREVPGQEDWYRKHKPRQDDMAAWGPYAAEVTRWSALVGEYRRVTRTQLAITGNGEGSR